MLSPRCYMGTKDTDTKISYCLTGEKIITCSVICTKEASVMCKVLWNNRRGEPWTRQGWAVPLNCTPILKLPYLLKAPEGPVKNQADAREIYSWKIAAWGSMCNFSALLTDCILQSIFHLGGRKLKFYGFEMWGDRGQDEKAGRN